MGEPQAGVPDDLTHTCFRSVIVEAACCFGTAGHRPGSTARCLVARRHSPLSGRAGSMPPACAPCRDDLWLASFPLNAATVLDYFAISPFYDRNCNNERAKQQGIDPSRLMCVPALPLTPCAHTLSRTPAQHNTKPASEPLGGPHPPQAPPRPWELRVAPSLPGAGFARGISC